MAAPWTVGSIVARLQLDTSPFSRALTDVVGLVRKLGSVFKGTLSALTSPLRFLEKQLFSIRGLIVGFASFKLVGLAKDVDDISGAFDNLQKSIGLDPQNTLRAMRKAVRDTVSDLDLMRSANQAVLLGVAKSTQEFMTLGDAARRLGKAVGRDAREGYDDLMVAFGRSSPRILDNLGIFVSLSAAVNDYKKSMNMTRDLTEAEQKVAFMTAGYKVMREKLKGLGADTMSFGDVVNALRAQVENAAAAFAKGLTPALTKLALWIGKLAKDYAPVLRELGLFFSELFDAIVLAANSMWKRLSEGQITIGGIVENLIEQAWKLVKGPILRAIIAIAGFIADTFIAQLSTSLAKIPDAITTALGDKFLEWWTWAWEGPEGVERLRKQIADIEAFKARRDAGLAGMDTAAQQKRNEVFAASLEHVKNEIQVLADETIEAAKAFVAYTSGVETAEEIFDRLDEAGHRVKSSLHDMGKAAKDAGKDIRLETGHVKNALEDLGDVWTSFQKRVQALKDEAADIGLSDVMKEVVKLAREYNALPKEKMDRAMQKQASDLFWEGRDAILAKGAFAVSKMEAGVEAEAAKAAIERQLLYASEYEKILAEVDQKWRDVVREQNLSNEAAERLRQKYALVADEAIKLKEAQTTKEAWTNFGAGLSSSIAGGIADGLRKGEKWSKIWADVTGDLFGRALTDVIERMSGTIGDALSKIMSELGAGAGFAGLGTGLLALAGTILGGLKSKKTATVDEFTNAINSSEAVRGLVAGPTNVAIAKVGDSLKGALRTTEILLERIAQAVEASPGARGAAPRNATYVLSPTTAT